MRVLETSGISLIYSNLFRRDLLSSPSWLKVLGWVVVVTNCIPSPNLRLYLKLGLRLDDSSKKNPQKSVIIQIFSRGLREVK